MAEYATSVTIKNVKTMPFGVMLRKLRPYVLEEVPEGIFQEQEAYLEIERLIGRLSNIYSWLIYLYAYVANEANEAKREKNNELKDELIRKKDALYELARGIRYKHEACSRMLTATLGYSESQVFEKPNGKKREEKAAEPKKKKGSGMKGWSTV